MLHTFSDGQETRFKHWIAAHHIEKTRCQSIQQTGAKVECITQADGKTLSKHFY